METISLTDKQHKESLIIDRLLNEYYNSLGITNYYNNKGYGKFMTFLIDQELIDNDLPIEKELGHNCNANNCHYLIFDNKFPIPNEINKQIINKIDEKRRYIFWVLNIVINI